MESQVNAGANAGAAAQVATPQPESQAQPPQEQLVPLSALQAERQQRQQLQESMKLMQDHVALLQANKTPTEPQDTLKDDDVLTVGDAKKFLAQTQQKTEAQLEELRMQQTFTDYADVIRTYLPEALKEDPELRDDIQRAANPYRLAYKFAKKSEAYQKAQREKITSPDALKAITNSQKTGNLSSVGTVAPAAPVGSYKTMSDAEFMKHVQKNMGYL